MMPRLLLAFLPFIATQELVLSSLFHNSGISFGVEPCSYFDNITDIQQLEQHQFASFEQCLYYFLATETQKKYANAAVPHAIASLPPSYGKRNRSVNVRVSQITLQHSHLNEFLKDLSIHGYLQLDWNDERLSWDSNRWKINQLQIRSASHVWLPLITAQSFDGALANGDTVEIRRIETTRRGNVSALVNFSLKTFCEDSDFKNFPDDVYKCCFQLEPFKNQDIIQLLADGMPVFTDPKSFRDYGWLMSGTIPTVSSDPISQLQFCINLQRSTNSVRIELTLPTWTCAILFLFTPFLGRIQIQINAKMFILFLQFLTLQLFSNRIAPHLGSASATPIILRILEFAIVMNTVSIITSILVWMFMRLKRTLPPWGWLSQASQIINRVLCIFNTVDEPDHDIELERQNSDKTGGAGRYQQDWNSAFIAIHGALMTAFSVVFIIGYLIIR
ncbi:hypothetical protein QR680_019377 [Steinernema hermaphroditum]|uniref:Neurotransmitter-gated ion-channel ligand-binding domain-containing protein n=1 Tax=Steinernema hermaphroditum TaxID=289476 RepID=A0AA39GP20_9BILA|nr:hypothetical protein QR680_019377 [Steinernema hermaphroditum]